MTSAAEGGGEAGEGVSKYLNFGKIVSNQACLSLCVRLLH